MARMSLSLEDHFWQTGIPYKLYCRDILYASVWHLMTLSFYSRICEDESSRATADGRMRNKRYLPIWIIGRNLDHNTV